MAALMMAAGPAVLAAPAGATEPTATETQADVLPGFVGLIPSNGGPGTRVHLTGHACNTDDVGIRIFFSSGAMTGSRQLGGPLRPDAEGNFGTVFEVPAFTDPAVPSVPGQYLFASFPETPGCLGTFTVNGPGPSFSLSPAAGPAGTTINAIGTGCTAGRVLVESEVEGTDSEGGQFADVGPDGHWQAVQGVPDGTQPGTGFQVTATCFVGTEPIFDFPSEPFTVTAAASAVSVTKAPTAAPVVGRPRFTG
jgi:hypothetical protein